MCGIVGYVGKKEVLPILINGLRRLEYRGYDSAGVVVLSEGKLTRIRSVGKIDALAEKVKSHPIKGTVGVAHTRWATHGSVNEDNAHPHTDCTGDLVLVHNGIIENYRELKEQFLKGHTFKSETDTEVIVHLIELFYQGDLRLAVERALHELRGTYGLVVMHSNEPGKLIAARLGSPIAIGVGDGEYYIASDTSPMLAHTQQVLFLDDGEIAEITDKGVQLFTLEDQKIYKKQRNG
jgi:glucosamine--fructose-6-phosphate aminotransferase (isomerizing)